MVKTFTYDLFISYADADKAWVEGYLLDALIEAGVRCHLESAFALGAPRVLEFERAIKQSRRTLLVISPAYLADDFTQFTDLLAQSYGIETSTWPVIPLILHPVQKLPPRLGMLTGLQATKEAERQAAIERLCTELQRPLPAPAAKPRCPYPGMQPFSKANSNQFFGRDSEVQEMIQHLRLHPFFAAIGPSGSGKSSLVFAGLLPALERSGLFGAGEWLVCTMRPLETPLANLTNALGHDLANPDLAVINILATQPNAQRLLLVVDQFEELFTYPSNKDKVVPFQEALQRLIQTPNCYLVLTVRADFYADLMVSPLWQEIQSHRIEVVPLDAAGLHEAIVKPSEDVGVYVEAALVERLVADAAGEPGVLPLLQETLVLLWERVERRFLPLSAYEALVLPRRAYGSLSGTQPTGLQVAITSRADAAFASLTDSQKVIARRIFLRLVQFGEGRPDTRRQQPINTLGDDLVDLETVLNRLVEARLLTITSAVNNSIKKVDISHEALIKSWPQLQEWIEQLKDAEQTRRRLVAKAEEWERLGKGSGGLLDEIELAEAERWLSSPDATELGYDASLIALVEASQLAIQQAEQERAARRRTQRMVIGGAATFILAAIGIAAGFELWRRGEALIASYDRWSGFRDSNLPRSENQQQSLSFLNDVNKRARKYEKEGKIDHAVAYYRQIRADSSMLLEEPQKKHSNLLSKDFEETICKENRLDKNNEDLDLKSLYQESEESICRIIETHRFPALVKALDLAKNTGQFGERLNEPNFEHQFTPGTPLQITYEILLTEKGSKADLDNNGEISELEAGMMPCKILRRIEQVWHNFTEQKCGWYDRESSFSLATTTYFDPNCRQLSYLVSDELSPTLTELVFPAPKDYAVARLNQCLGLKLKAGGD